MIPGLLTVNALFLTDRLEHATTPSYMRWAWWFALCSSAVLPLIFSAAIAPQVERAIAYPAAAAVSLASAAAITCWQSRPSIQLQFAASWLAALPISSRQLTLWEAARTARLLIPIVPFLIIALAEHRDQLALLLSSLLAGSATGFGLAGHSSRHSSREGPTPSTDGIRRLIAGPGRKAIAKVPLAWSAARLSGKRLSPWLTATLLSIPAGIGGGSSMLMVAVTVLILALVWLMAGAWSHLFLLSAWLATTPMSPGTFARLTLSRVSAWFFGILTMLLAVLAALQMPIQGIVFISSWVLGCVVACFSTAFRHRFNAVVARRSGLLIVTGMSVFVLFAPGLWLALIAPIVAALIAIWQLRQVKP